MGDSIAIMLAVALSFKTRSMDAVAITVFYCLLCACAAVFDAIGLYVELMLMTLNVLAILFFPMTILGSRIVSFSFAGYCLLCSAHAYGYIFAVEYFTQIIWVIFSVQLLGAWNGHRKRSLLFDSGDIHNHQSCTSKG